MTRRTVDQVAAYDDELELLRRENAALKDELKQNTRQRERLAVQVNTIRGHYEPATVATMLAFVLICRVSLLYVEGAKEAFWIDVLFYCFAGFLSGFLLLVAFKESNYFVVPKGAIVLTASYVFVKCWHEHPLIMSTIMLGAAVLAGSYFVELSAAAFSDFLKHPIDALKGLYDKRREA